MFVSVEEVHFVILFWFCLFAIIYMRSCDMIWVG